MSAGPPDEMDPIIWSSRVASLRSWRGVVIGLFAGSALAGPPYITDDPVPTETGQWEVFTFGEREFDAGQSTTTAGFDINYGLVEGVQITAVPTMEWQAGSSAQMGNTEIGIKYRFIHSRSGAFQVALFPKVVLPTSPATSGVSYRIPLWAQRDFGPWSLFGGGGVTLQHGEGKQDFWETGIALSREFREGLSFGVEFADSGAEEVDDHGATTVDVASTIHLSGPLSLVLSVGPVFAHHAGRVSTRGYLGLLTNY